MQIVKGETAKERHVPWSGLGKDISRADSLEEALQMAGLDWNVVQRPAALMEGEDSVVLEGQYVNVREDTGMPLGIVGRKYSIVQNYDAFSFTESLIGYGVRFETAGMFKNGRAVWLLAKLPGEHFAAGDEVSLYVVFINNHDGLGGIKAAVTPVRVVCSNMLNFSMKRALRTWTVRHSGDIHSKLDTARDILLKSSGYMDAVKDEIEELRNIRLSEREVKSIIEQLVPMDENAGIRQRNNRSLIREDIMERFISAPDLMDMEDTGLKLLHAVSDHATHFEPLRKSSLWKENHLISSFKGLDMTDRAKELIFSV